MLWKFEIIDRDDIATVIEEPIGWDQNASEIKRDPDYHGIFFTNQGESFEFTDLAMRLIKAEYDQYGFEGNMTLVMSENCGLGYEEFSRGRFDFNKYEYVCGDSCYVKIPVEKSGQIVEVRNRLNQKVNLETLKAFDQVTDLPPYDKLAFTLELPSKGLFLANKFRMDEDFSTSVLGVPQNNNPGNTSATYNSEYGMIELGFDNQIATEIGNAGTGSQPLYSCILTSAGTLGCNSLNRFPLPATTNEIAPLDISSIVNFQEGTINYGQISDTVNIDIQLLGSLRSINCQFNGVYFVLATLPLGADGTVPSAYIYHEVHTFQAGVNTPVGTEISLNYSYINPAFILNEGDMVFAFISMYHRRQNAYAGTDAYTMALDAGSHFYMDTLSHTPATDAKVFAINETISRVAESITNDKLRAYSEYFGRTDSQPYALPDDGCGSLEVVTDGIRIRRQENKIPGTTNLFTLSLQDIFESLSPIHNIGMGIEVDTLRTGYDRLRVEPWHFFYNDSVIMSCTGIGKVTRKAYDKEAFSTFQFGFSKWEAEEFNGLDEFLSKRTGRTSLSQIKNDLVKLSKWIGSGYAIEVTRRKGNKDTKDWRYDKDTFIICCKRKGGTYTAQSLFTASTGQIFSDGITNPVFFKPGHIYAVTGTALNNGTFTCITSINPYTTIFFITTDVAILDESVVATFEDITPNLISVELGNVLFPTNIIDPDTLYNYRISPMRNAMRWMNKVFASYRQFGLDCQLLFTDGDGNYFASGEMADNNCRLENGPISENQTIDISIFSDPDDAKPFLLPERVSFEYPMSTKEYKLIEANPYGLIYFESDCEQGYGYIDTINYKMEEGLASFNLIPAITLLAFPPAILDAIITEEGFNILQEDGQYLETE